MPTTRPGQLSHQRVHARGPALLRHRRFSFDATSFATGFTRHYKRFSQVVEEVIDVWAGLHFRTADVQDAVLGKKVAHCVDKHYFRPLD